MQIPGVDTSNRRMSAEKSIFPFWRISIERKPTFSIICQHIFLQNHSRKMDFGSKFPILISIPEMVGCQPQKSRILCPQPNKHLLEWHLDWISRQEKSGFPANMPAGASFSPPKVQIAQQRARRGLFPPQKSPDFPPTCPQGLHFSPKKVRTPQQHARRGFIFLKK